MWVLRKEGGVILGQASLHSHRSLCSPGRAGIIAPSLESEETDEVSKQTLERKGLEEKREDG